MTTFGLIYERCKEFGDFGKMLIEFINIFKDLCEDKTSYSDTEYLWVMPFNDGSRGQFLNYNSPKSTGANGQLKNQKTDCRAKNLHRKG